MKRVLSFIFVLNPLVAPSHSPSHSPFSADMMGALHNYVTVAPDQFLGNPQYVEIMYNMCKVVSYLTVPLQGMVLPLEIVPLPGIIPLPGIVPLPGILPLPGMVPLPGTSFKAPDSLLKSLIL